MTATLNVAIAQANYDQETKVRFVKSEKVIKPEQFYLNVLFVENHRKTKNFVNPELLLP